MSNKKSKYKTAAQIVEENKEHIPEMPMDLPTDEVQPHSDYVPTMWPNIESVTPTTVIRACHVCSSKIKLDAVTMEIHGKTFTRCSCGSYSALGHKGTPANVVNGKLEGLFTTSDLGAALVDDVIEVRGPFVAGIRPDAILRRGKVEPDHITIPERAGVAKIAMALGYSVDAGQIVRLTKPS